jgi:uncharacterized iron-regulated membrane protein
LRKWHCWLGWSLGWMMLIWFVSGAVMIFAHFPMQYRNPENRHGVGPGLQAEQIQVDLAQAWKAAGAPQDLFQARLGRVAGRPAYIFSMLRQRPRVVWADTGVIPEKIDEKLAFAVARQALGKDARLNYQGLVNSDQWTIGPLSRAGLGPYHLITAQGPAETEIYISSKTGEVCQLTTCKNRFWSWVGSIPHWLYFGFLRRHLELWRWGVIVLAFLGCVLCVTGLWQGVRYFRPGGYGKGRHHRLSAFVGLRKWHHYLGLVFGLPALALVFSGMMSLNPFDWCTPSRPGPKLMAALSGGHLDPSQCRLKVPDLLAALGQEFPAKMLSLINFQGRPYYLAVDGAGASRLAPAWETQPRVLESLPPADLAAAAHAVMPDHQIASADLLDQGGLYLPKWNKPILKLAFDDPAETWLFIDPARANIICRLDDSGRLNRWLYKFLHTLDLPWLVQHELVRQALLLVILAGGFLLCLTGFWSRLSRRRKL